MNVGRGEFGGRNKGHQLRDEGTNRAMEMEREAATLHATERYRVVPVPWENMI